MNVILCEDVDNLGDMGETVRVAPGYARNFLLPRKLAVVADSASARQIEHEMRIIKKREVKRRSELAEVAQGMEGIKVEFTAKAGAEGKLFGSVTSLHISTKLKELGHPVNRRKIQLAEPIKSLGEHEVQVTLTSGIGATIKVIVEAEEPEPGVPDFDDDDDRKVRPAAKETSDEDETSPDETAEPVAESDETTPQDPEEDPMPEVKVDPQ